MLFKTLRQFFEYSKKKYPLVKFIYTDNMPRWKGAYAKLILFWPFCRIYIRPKYKNSNDIGIHVHELTHVKQHYRTLFIHPFLYTYFKKYRLKAETEAYIEQLKYYKNPESCLTWLSYTFVYNYNFFKTIEQAKKYIVNNILSKV